MDQREAYNLLAAESPFWAIEPSRLEGIATLIANGVTAALPSRRAPASPRGVALVPIPGRCRLFHPRDAVAPTSTAAI